MPTFPHNRLQNLTPEALEVPKSVGCKWVGTQTPASLMVSRAAGQPLKVCVRKTMWLTL